MDKSELSKWALSNGWRMIADCPSLVKPSAPQQAIVRLVLKTGVAQLEIKKPAGKWEKVVSQSYSKIIADPQTGLPRGLGLDTISGFASLMQDNKNSMVFDKRPERPKDQEA